MAKIPHGSQGNLGHIVCCYDMGGTVTAFGSILGPAVRYCYMKTFGYINTVDLIGEGKCNNPFYPISTSRMKVAQPDAVRPVRYDFANHAFAECNGLVFDACAGPVLGVTETEFIATTIDISTPVEAAKAGTASQIAPQTLTNIE